MSERNSIAPTPSGKPTKPYPDFPLTAHATRRWCKLPLSAVDLKRGIIDFPRPTFGGQEVGLLPRVGLGRDGADLAPAQAERFFQQARTWVRPRRMPVWRSMADYQTRSES
ncbi:MAG TPA: hypothetical protein VH643_07620 [Gemmataceae bacterium]|jgi:hypothetical protein